MKNILLLTTLSIFALVGCDESSSGGSSTEPNHPKPVAEGKGSWWESESTKLKWQVQQDKRQIAQLEEQLKAAQEEKAKAEDERDVAIDGKNQSDLWLEVVVGTIGCVIIAVLILIGKALFFRPAGVATSEVLDHCPRCGVKRTTGESICRECGTHF